MKTKLLVIIAILILVAVVFGQRGRSRYGPNWADRLVGPYGEIIDNETDGSWDFNGAELVHDSDIVYMMKTVIKTIDLDDDASADDFQFNDDESGTNAQNVDLGIIIPAYAEVQSAMIRCFESVDPGTFQVTLGVTTGDDSILGIATVDAANELVATPAGGSPLFTPIATAQHVWIQGNPSADWGDTVRGRWAVMVTYIDYDAVYTAEGP